MGFWGKVKQRLLEPSSWAGIGLVTAGAAQVFKIDHGQQIADVLTATGQTVAHSDGLVVPLGTLLTGVLAIFMREGR